MKLLNFCLIITLAAAPASIFAQRIVDISSRQDRLVNPAIVMQSSTVEPDCHTYTGCSLVVEKKHYYTPKHIKHIKHKRHHTYHRSCCVVGGCYYVSPGIYPYWDYR